MENISQSKLLKNQIVEIKLDLSSSNKISDFNFLEFIEKFTQNIIEQSFNYNYENYKNIIIDFNQKIPSLVNCKILSSNKNPYKEIYEKFKDSMMSDKTENKQEDIEENKIKANDQFDTSHLKITIDYSEINSAMTQVLTYILNFENIFLNFTNKSLEITYDLILLLIEYKLIDCPHLIISYLNKLIQFSKNSYIEKEYLTRLKIIMENLNLCEKMKSHLQLLRFTFDKIEGRENFQNKNFIKLTEILDEEMENSSLTEDMMNKNFSLSSSIDLEFNSLENFKTKVNENLKSEGVLKVYRELKRESLLIEDAMNNRVFGVYYFSRFSNLQIKYLYIFKKILDSLDDINDANMKKIFFNLVFRSKTFSQYLLRETYISNNFINSPDKEIYVNSYYSISHFFSKHILNVDSKKLELYGKLVDKILINFKNEIKKLLEVKKQKYLEFKLIEYNFETSNFNKELSSYMYSSFFNYEFGEILMNVNVFNLTFKSLRILINEMKELFVRVTSVDYVTVSNTNIFLSISTIYIKNIHLIISFNSNVVFGQNQIYPMINSDPIFFNLFIFIKFWAMQRKLVITVDNEFKKENEEDFLFDNYLLMILVVYYLLNIGALQKINKKDAKQFFKFFKQKVFREIKKENSTEYEIEEVVYISHKLSVEGNKFSQKRKKSFELGRLFVNFFYFVLQMINKAKQNPDFNILIDLNFESPNIIKRKPNSTLIFVDFLSKYSNQKSLMLCELPNYCKNLHEFLQLESLNENDKDFSLINKNSDHDILEVWDANKSNKLEREANRLLHYLLKCEEEDLIRIFMKNNS